MSVVWCNVRAKLRRSLDCVRPRRSQGSHSRRGAAVVELALMLPLLAFLFVIAVDFSRVYYYSLTLQNAARSGALYASDPGVQHESPYASVEEAALADAQNLSPPPTITTTNGIDAAGRTYVEVTAAYSYQTITAFPGVPNQSDVRRSVRMYRAAMTPY